MFRNPKRGTRETLLPHSGNGRGGGGGLYGTARMTPKASLSKSFIATMMWALVRLSMFSGAGGFYGALQCGDGRLDKLPAFVLLPTIRAACVLQIADHPRSMYWLAHIHTHIADDCCCDLCAFGSS